MFVGREQAGVPSAVGWSCLVAAGVRKEGEEGLNPGLLYQSAPFKGGLGHGLCVVSGWGWLQTQERHGG